MGNAVGAGSYKDLREGRVQKVYRGTLMDRREEGWCTDPYDRHEQRWFSDGKPTKLVQDMGVTSYDPPPDGPPNHLPQKVETRPNLGPADLQRADDAEGAPDLDMVNLYTEHGRRVLLGSPSEWITRYERLKWWRYAFALAAFIIFIALLGLPTYGSYSIPKIGVSFPRSVVLRR